MDDWDPVRRTALSERVLAGRSALPRALVERLERPVRPFAIVMGWIGSTMLFLLVATGLGGPTEGDSAEVVYGTWAVAHGHLACVYPATGGHLPQGFADPFALAAPLYALVSGVVAAALRIGHAVPFPSGHALGPGCANGFNAIYHWSTTSAAILPTVRVGYVTWAVLLAGVVYLVRATPLRATGWEVVAGFLVALAPPVVMCLTYYFHPQDLLAMALVLVAVGAWLRGHHLVGGVWLGLALAAQQFAVLAVVALLVLSERDRIVRLLGGLVAAVAVVDGTFVAVSGLRAVKTVLFGSSRVGSSVSAHGGTVVFALGLHGVADFLLARVAPIAAAALVAWLVRRRVGRSPRAVVGALSAAMLCRLVFEVNIFGYYFMAVMVGVVLLEVLRHQVGRDVVALVGLFIVSFDPEHIALVDNLTTYGLSVYYDLPIVVLALGVALFLFDAVRRRFSPALVVWLGFVALAGESHLWNRYNPLWDLPEWAWQIVLVPFLGVILARRLRETRRDEPSGAPGALEASALV